MIYIYQRTKMNNLFNEFEENLVKQDHKTICIVHGSFKGNFLHTNQMSFLVERIFHKSFSEMTYQEMYDYGVRTGHIEASCDHPPFYPCYYGTTMRSSDTNPSLALISYYGQEGFEKGRTFVKFSKIPWMIDLDYYMNFRK